VSIKGSLTHERQAQPGEIYRGTITVINPGGDLEEVKVYQTDYHFVSDGRCFYDDPGANPRSNASWITFSPHLVTITPEGNSIINYTVAVTQEEGLIGTYWSILMIEVMPKGYQEVTSPERTAAKLGIRQIVRYGIQIVTHIGNTGQRRLEFANTKLLRDGDLRLFQVDVENVGERWLRPVLWTELYGKDGSYRGRLEGGVLRVYPGTSARFTFDVTHIARGDYKALVIADCGADDVFGATYPLRFEGEDPFDATYTVRLQDEKTPSQH
jgi:hypothetical protein